MADALTQASTSNFSNHPIEFLRRTLEEKGDRLLAYHEMAEKFAVPEGNSKAVRMGRYQALPVVLDALTEGTAPDAIALGIDDITVTLAQYGQVVKISDVHKMTIAHDSFQQAKDELKRSHDDSRDYQLQNVLNAGTNVFYPNAKTARSALTSDDTPDSQTIKRMVSAIKNPDAKGRAPKRFKNNLFGAVVHEKIAAELMDDNQISAALVRGLAGRKDLIDGTFGVWHGVQFVETNFSPEYEGLGAFDVSATVTEGVAFASGDLPTAVENELLVGTKLTSGSGGSLSALTEYDFTITAVNKYRGFEEKISGILDYSTTTGSTKVTITMPSDTDHEYYAYVGTNGGTRYRVGSRTAAGGTIEVTSVPSSGTTAPVAPAAGVEVFVTHIFGRGAFKVAELEVDRMLETKGPDSGNPLDQFRYFGYKYFDGPVLTNGLWLARGEFASSYS